MKRIVVCFFVAAVCILTSSQVMATRGAMPHAYGTRATGLGSAFDAISDDAISPAVYNPAGLTQIKNKRFDMDMIFLRPYLGLKQKNVNPQNGQNGRATAQGFIPEDNLLLNNDTGGRTAKNNYFIMGGMGFAMRISKKAVLGAAFVGRAGGGSNYRIKQTPFSFILPYDANDTPADQSDDFLVPLATTRRGRIVSTGTADLPLTDSQQLTTPSDLAYFVGTEYSTDLKIPEFGPAIGYEVNDYLSIGVSARLVAGHFRFRQAVGTSATIMKGTGIFNNGQALGASAPQAVKDQGLDNYGGVLSGKFKDPNLGGVQFGYQEVQGIGRLENSYAAGFGWGTGIHYRPYGSDKLVLSVSYKSRAVMDYKGGELMFDFSDQFRKFYYDTAQFGEFANSTFGASYLSGGAVTFRAPKFFNALLGTIDYPASQGNVQAQKAMEWFFNGTNKDGRPTLVLDANGYARSINLTAFYDPYTQMALPQELAFGAAWRPAERLLLAIEYRRIYMDDFVGDNFTIDLGSGSSPFFDWLMGIENDEKFAFPMNTDFNTIRSISVGVEYDLGDKWTIRGGVQHSNNTFTADHLPFTFNMQPEDELSLGFGYRLSRHILLDFAGSVAGTWDTTESKGPEKTGPARYVDANGDGFIDLSVDLNNTSGDYYIPGSNIDQFHSNSEFDHKQWQVNFGIAFVW